MNLTQVKNGQHFCLKRWPTKIYLRLNDLTQDFDSYRGSSQQCVTVKSLRTGKIVYVDEPKKVTVIALGKANKKKNI
jgi:hypothetical protein